jgi:hypothetical protein
MIAFYSSTGKLPIWWVTIQEGDDLAHRGNAISFTIPASSEAHAIRIVCAIEQREAEIDLRLQDSANLVEFWNQTAAWKMPIGEFWTAMKEAYLARKP